MPIPNLCMRPNEYADVRLFIPREGYDEILAELSLYLNSPGVKGRRFMVYGDRGVGQSITVQGERCNSEKELLRALAEELARQTKG